MNNEVLDNLDFQQESYVQQMEENMKIIKLKRLELTNFKGIAHRIIEFKDTETWIYGANGTGKSTIFDAFTWLLFGKDSHGQSEDKAKIKMQDKDGIPVWHTDNTVEGTFEINGEELVLKRTYTERWRKPSGQAEKVYDGQTTLYSWNGNEKIGSTEYKRRVNDLINEGLFKLITDPLFFASQDVKERRKIVLAMAGEVADEAIRSHNAELKDFDPTSDVEEKRSIAISTKNRLIKDRDNYPARIDEQMQFVTRKQQEIKEINLPDKANLMAGKEQAEKGLRLVEEKQENISKRIADITSKNSERISKINNLEKYKNDVQQKANSEILEFNNKNHELIRKKEQLKSEIATLEFRISKGNEQIKETSEELNAIKKAIDEVSSQPIPDFKELEVCPTCHRPFNESEIATKKDEMLGNWKETLNIKISNLRNQGNKLFEKGKTFKTAIEELEKQKSDLEIKVQELESQIVDDKPYVTVNLDNDEVYKKMLSDIPEEISISDTIEQQNNEISSQRAYYKGLIDGFNDQLNMYAKIDVMNADIKNANLRIEHLQKEQLEVNQGIAEQEKIIYLCDLWTKTKIEMMNDLVSSKFNLVKFKMYTYTKDGNPVATCEITVNGVDYTALNTASKLNAGLDIINALINYYGVKAPIFIDNRESVTEIIAPETQVINLAVKEGEI